VNLTQNIYFSFASATRVHVLCYLVAQYVTTMTKFYSMYVTMVVNAKC